MTCGYLSSCLGHKFALNKRLTSNRHSCVRDNILTRTVGVTALDRPLFCFFSTEIPATFCTPPSTAHQLCYARWIQWHSITMCLIVSVLFQYLLHSIYRPLSSSSWLVLQGVAHLLWCYRKNCIDPSFSCFMNSQWLFHFHPVPPHTCLGFLHS